MSRLGPLARFLKDMESDMLNETDRRAAFKASPLLMGFLGTMLEDLQNNEREAAFEDEREEIDAGTIWNCPDVTFNGARSICDTFYSGPGGDAAAESDCTYEQIGSDLYLESAGHGAGFSDRDHDGDRDASRAIAERLSAAVSRHSVETYIGDDGAAYIVGMESDMSDTPTARSILSRVLRERRDDFNAMLRARIASDRAYYDTLAPTNATRRSVRASFWAAEKAQTWADLGDIDALVSECGPIIIALGIACKLLDIPAHVRTAVAVAWDEGRR